MTTEDMTEDKKGEKKGAVWLIVRETRQQQYWLLCQFIKTDIYTHLETNYLLKTAAKLAYLSLELTECLLSRGRHTQLRASKI